MQFSLRGDLSAIVKQLEQVPLSGDDIERLTGAQPVLYTDLSDVTDITTLCTNKYNGFILLYQRTANSGHYVSVYLNDNGTLDIFDSYGLALDHELKYLQYYKVGSSGIPELTRLVKSYMADHHVYVNRYKLQSFQIATNTCGVWAITRQRMKHLNNRQFSELFLRQPISPEAVLALMNLFDVYSGYYLRL